MTQKRNMPSVAKVFRYWYEQYNEIAEGDGFNDLCSGLQNMYYDPGEPCCMRCGWRVPEVKEIKEARAKSLNAVWNKANQWLDRAHLADHMQGGSSEPENLFMLCGPCHDKMPSFSDRNKALEWVTTFTRPKNFAMWQMCTEADENNQAPFMSSREVLRGKRLFNEMLADNYAI